MTRYSPDELNAAQEDLFTAETMVAVMERFKNSLRIRAGELNKNAELIEEMCAHIDEAAQDTIMVIIGLAKDVGASSALYLSDDVTWQKLQVVLTESK